MNLSRIGQEVSAAGSSCVGTTTHAPSTFQCQDISKSSFKNTSKKCPKNRNIARVHASTESIRGQSTSPNPSRYLPKIIQQRNKGNSTKGNSTCRWEHFVLRADGRHHGPDGPQFYCKRANARHNKHDGKGQTNVGLPRDTSERDHTVPSVGHGFERPFRRILPLGDKVHGMVPQGRGPDQIKWGIFYIVYHPSICCGFGGRGQTWRSLPQLQRRNNFSTHPGTTGASPAKDTGALRRCHHRRHHKQHHKTTTIAIDGNAIFLGW